MSISEVTSKFSSHTNHKISVKCPEGIWVSALDKEVVFSTNDSLDYFIKEMRNFLRWVEAAVEAAERKAGKKHD